MVGAVFALLTVFGMNFHQSTKLEPPSQLQGVKRIVIIGDSITQQGEAPGGYVWLVRHYLNRIYPQVGFQVINAGISGHKSTDMLARFQHDVIRHHPELVLISVGVNDVWHGFYDGHTKGDGPLGVPVWNYRQNVQKMIESAQVNKSRVILMLTTPIGEDLFNAENTKARTYNRALIDIAEETKSQVVDLHSPFAELIRAYRKTTGNSSNFLTVDGVHMNALGNQVMAQTILTAFGIPDEARAAASAKVNEDIQMSRPKPGPLPKGQVLSYDRQCFSSSDFSATYNANQPVESGKLYEQRWCSNTGDFKPNPWWTVDLGEVKALSGIHIEFAPDDPDTWKYKVQVSNDNKLFQDVVDRSTAEDYVSQENHTFPANIHARFVRILFTGETRAQNWASLRFVQVFGK